MASLKSQVEWCSRVQWSLGVAVAIIVVCFVLLGYLPELREQRELAAEKEQKRRQRDDMESRVSTLEIVEAEVERLSTRLDRVGRKLPRKPDLGGFVTDITQLARQTSLRRMTNQPGAPKRNELFGEQPIALTFEGNFSDVFLFLRQVEEMQRLTRIRNIKIRSVDSKAGVVDVSLLMSIYFSEG